MCCEVREYWEGEGALRNDQWMALTLGFLSVDVLSGWLLEKLSS